MLLTILINHPATERARCYVRSVGFDRKNAEQDTLAREIHAVMWGIAWSLHYRSVLAERGDLLSSYHRHGYGKQNDSISTTIVQAFTSDQRPAVDVAEAC